MTVGHVTSNVPVGLTFRMLPPPQHRLVRPTPDNPSPKENPPIFNDAMVVRNHVFVDEQKCDPVNEIDADDERSWHFVIYEDGATGTASDTSTSHPPIGVLRLVPPPHPPHAEIASTNTTFREPQEPYIKLGRFAFMREYRGRGLAVALAEAALEWARTHAHEITAALHSEAMAEKKTVTHTSGCGRSSKSTDTDGEGDERWRGLALVHAQKYAEGLYGKKLGFVTDASMGEWIEENMTHIGMWRRLSVR